MSWQATARHPGDEGFNQRAATPPTRSHLRSRPPHKGEVNQDSMRTDSHLLCCGVPGAEPGISRRPADSVLAEATR